MTKRCQWCGVFVRRDTPETAWRVKCGYRGGDGENLQNPRSWWNYWKKTLCPTCSASVTAGSWRRVTVAEVLRRHAAGWDPERPFARVK